MWCFNDSVYNTPQAIVGAFDDYLVGVFSSANCVAYLNPKPSFSSINMPLLTGDIDAQGLMELRNKMTSGPGGFSSFFRRDCHSV